MIAIEVLCACQAIDLLAPLTTSPALARCIGSCDRACRRSMNDRSPAPDIVAISELIATNAFEDACGGRVK